jgi:carboxyl-terminal processing protease
VLVGGAALHAASIGTTAPPRLEPAGLVVLAPPEAAEPSDRNPTEERPLGRPTGAPPRLTCQQARTIVRQARRLLASPPPRIEPGAFGKAVSDWVDPHGLWSVAPDAPAGAEIAAHASELLDDLHATVGPCAAARTLGGKLRGSVEALRVPFADARAKATSAARAARDPWEKAREGSFEDGPVSRPARDLARRLGEAVGEAERDYGESVAFAAALAIDRYLPAFGDDAWSEVLLAAAVRAYVPQLDVHGAWAPLEEELSVYDLALERAPPPRAFAELTRTALGVRIDGDAMEPLAVGDVVLQIGDTPLVGASVEQVEQLAVLDGELAKVTVLRRGHKAPLVLDVRVEGEAGLLPADGPPLPLELVGFGDGVAAVVRLEDVPDDLGDRLRATLDELGGFGKVRGLLLDLRGNGGGSTEGAREALGLFLPGAPLFPMKRRDGAVEVERAPRRGPVAWSGPLAVLVDGESASAAEMLAGALSAYGRAVVVGGRTYGKGCAQEYTDDDAHAGVLRVTTLVFALPNGAPLQKVGISPDIDLGLAPPREREEALSASVAPWRGDDVREAVPVPRAVWPTHGGRVGPCRDTILCRGLRALGASPAARKPPVR